METVLRVQLKDYDGKISFLDVTFAQLCEHYLEIGPDRRNLTADQRAEKRAQDRAFLDGHATKKGPLGEVLILRFL